MRPSLFRHLSIAAVVTMLIMSGASVASAADEDTHFTVTAAPNKVYAVAGEDTWDLQISFTQDDKPAALPEPSSLTVTSESSALTFSEIANPELGSYTTSVSASEPGTYDLTVTYDGQRAGSSRVQFFSSGPDPSQSTLSAIPEAIVAPCESAVIEDPVIATATVRDDRGTGIPGLEVVFEYEDEPSKSGITDNNGVASVELLFAVPPSPTTKIVNATITVDDTVIDLPTATVEIQPTEGCTGAALTLNWTLEASTQVVGMGLRVLITALDADGQVTTLDATKLTVIPSSSNVTMGTLARRVGGAYYVTLQSSVPGDYTVNVTYDGQVYGQALPFSFVEPAPVPHILPDLDQSYFYLSKWLAEPGDQVLVTVVMKDATGQPATGAQVRFNMYQTDTFQTTCITLADGRCSVTVSEPAPATIGINVYFRDKMFGSNQTIYFLGDDERDNQVSMAVTPVSGGPVRADGYDSWEASVTMANPDGTPATDALGVLLTVIDANTNAMTTTLDMSAVDKQPDGVYHFYLTSLVPGSFLVYAWFGWTWADPVTVSFTAVPADEPGARLLITRESFNGVQVSEVDREVLAEAVVHDEQGLPRSSVKVDFSLGSDEDVLSARQCYTDSKGQCSVRMWPNGLGVHQVSASIAGESLVGSPVAVRLIPPWIPGLYDPEEIKLTEFALTPADGDLVPADGVSQWLGMVTIEAEYPLSGVIEHPEQMFTPSDPAVIVGDVIDNGDNTFSTTFTSDKSGEFTVTAYYLGVAIEREITFGEAPPNPDPQQSSLAAASAMANTGTDVVLTAMVKDSAGVVMKDVDVDFIAEAPGVLSQQTCTTESDGRCTVTIKSDEAADIRVSASVNAEEISGSPVTIRFQAVSPSPSASTTSPSPSSSTTSASPTASTTSPSPTASSTSASPSETSTAPTSSTTSAAPTSTTTSTSPIQSSTSTTTSPIQSSTSSTTSTQSPTSATSSSTSSSPSSTSTTSAPSPTASSTSSNPSETSTTPTSSTTSASVTQSSTPVSPTAPPTAPTQSSTSGTPTPTSPTSTSTSLPPTNTASQSPTGKLTDSPTSAHPTQSTSSAYSPTEAPTTPVQTPTHPVQTPTGSPTGPTQSSTGPTQAPTSPAQSVTQSPTNSPMGNPTLPTSNPPQIDLNVGTVTPGQTLRIGGDNWYPGEMVRVTMYSTERVLGIEKVNSDGTLPPMNVVIPSDLEAGQHTIKVEGSVSGVFTTSFTVLAPSPATSAATTTPVVSTGGTALQSPARWVLFGFIAIGVSAILNRTLCQPKRR